jgi:N-methylhydantoinase A/oxoprolinase/acetone carboxylase beta subunit
MRYAKQVFASVYWYELGGFADTPVLRLAGGTVADRLEGPLLFELPDTVVVLRPGQAAEFGELGSLVVNIGSAVSR